MARSTPLRQAQGKAVELAGIILLAVAVPLLIPAMNGGGTTPARLSYLPAFEGTRQQPFGSHRIDDLQRLNPGYVHSLDFVVFFVAVTAIYWWLPHRGQNILLFVASYFFSGRALPVPARPALLGAAVDTQRVGGAAPAA